MSPTVEEENDLNSIHYIHEKTFWELISTDLTLYDYNEGIDAFDELKKAKDEGVSLWSLIAEENPNWVKAKRAVGYVIVMILTKIVRHKMNKFQRKHPEWLL